MGGTLLQPLSDNRKNRTGESAYATRRSIGIALRGSHSRNSCKILGNGDARPCRSVEKPQDFLSGVMTEFQNEDAARSEQDYLLRNKRGVEFRARFTTEERHFRFMFANFARQRPRFPAADVGRVAGDEVERQ